LCEGLKCGASVWLGQASRQNSEQRSVISLFFKYRSNRGVDARDFPGFCFLFPLPDLTVVAP
ncbi:MAG: hypothetical protein ACRD3S_06030, partial [Terracidiphilus sp.]